MQPPHISPPPVGTAAPAPRKHAGWAAAHSSTN
jgi:hypothetical protein